MSVDGHGGWGQYCKKSSPVATRASELQMRPATCRFHQIDSLEGFDGPVVQGLSALQHDQREPARFRAFLELLASVPRTSPKRMASESLKAIRRFRVRPREPVPGPGPARQLT